MAAMSTRTVLRRAVGFLAVLAALASVVCPIAAWILGWGIILSAAGGERHAIHENDKPASYHRLQFGAWKSGVGPCRPSHVANIAEDAEIIAYRIGQAQGPITRFTYYEANYQMPDGRLRVTHAEGPIPLISHRSDAIIVTTAGGVLLSLALFFVEYLLPKKPTGSPKAPASAQ